MQERRKKRSSELEVVVGQPLATTIFFKLEDG
jgi:hypothetical protein